MTEISIYTPDNEYDYYYYCPEKYSEYKSRLYFRVFITVKLKFCLSPISNIYIIKWIFLYVFLSVYLFVYIQISREITHVALIQTPKVKLTSRIGPSASSFLFTTSGNKTISIMRRKSPIFWIYSVQYNQIDELLGFKEDLEGEVFFISNIILLYFFIFLKIGQKFSKISVLF